ncbi:myeloid cell nuclear differentiation antigen-like isoform 2-T2 [Dugong dugon]
MVNEHKKIFLLKALEAINEYQFNIIARKIKGKETTSMKKSRQEEADSVTPAPTTSNAVTSERVEETPGGQKRKNTIKEKSGIKRNKVSQEQTQSPCPSGASTSATLGHPPPLQISSSTPPSTSLPEE